jgi:hypothetical protein
VWSAVTGTNESLLKRVRCSGRGVHTVVSSMALVATVVGVK